MAVIVGNRTTGHRFPRSLAARFPRGDLARREPHPRVGLVCARFNALPSSGALATTLSGGRAPVTIGCTANSDTPDALLPPGYKGRCRRAPDWSAIRQLGAAEKSRQPNFPFARDPGVVRTDTSSEMTTVLPIGSAECPAADPPHCRGEPEKADTPHEVGKPPIRFPLAGRRIFGPSASFSTSLSEGVSRNFCVHNNKRGPDRRL
jgi:hypothetical protein